MKFFVLFLVFVSAQAARIKFARVEAPYPTAGYPQGPSLNLPGEYGPPEDAYGSLGSSSEKPVDAYGTPANGANPEDAYGSPNNPEDAYGSPNKPEDAYGKPESASEDPEDAYGTPEGQKPTTEKVDIEAGEETDLPAGDNIAVSNAVSNGERKSQKLRNGKRVENVNVYYVYTPNGLIQYSRNPSPSAELKNAYTSGVYYQDVQNPIYSFAPENYF
ncbi:PREDICTED: postacrosomal sheath WW domain-binding protein-like [Nicrophorus vespilloides]|uniref:Postacrosomal sheath WW domain-binding protein-like n=1 Tax=Nicrophorus vespilloides TaxID=110193 RepID=A0ABM1N2D8_NICVS|nr:PREDICTED: postacrosomal sheath WW domain-binding protein-like [Nicrophorus vespilloides]